MLGMIFTSSHTNSAPRVILAGYSHLIESSNSLSTGALLERKDHDSDVDEFSNLIRKFHCHPRSPKRWRFWALKRFVIWSLERKKWRKWRMTCLTLVDCTLVTCRNLATFDIPPIHLELGFGGGNLDESQVIAALIPQRSIPSYSSSWRKVI